MVKTLKNFSPLECWFAMLRSLPFILPLLWCQQLAHCLPRNNKIFRHSVPADICIVDVNVERHEHADFARIGEYFNGGTEYKGQRCIVRDDENVRAGLYFVVNFDRPLDRLPKDLSVNVYLMLGRSLAPEKFEFKLPNKRQKLVSEVYCGITSKHTNGLKKINAWKVEATDGSGNAIASHKSYMWPKNL
jgi:hypothetical protein